MVATSDRIAEYVALTRRKRALTEELKDATYALARMEEVLVECFAAEGLQSVKAQDGSTAYLNRQIWASLQDNADGQAFRALEDQGLGWMVKPNVNHQVLSAEVREWPRDGEGQVVVPEGLIPFLKISDSYKVSVRLNGA